MKIGSLDISSIKVGNSDCSVYIGNTKIYPTSPQPTGQTPCYAVVDDISQYHSSDFVDVFNLSDGDWYKLNDQGFFEKYGIYGEGRDPYSQGTGVTTYNGKLTIDDGYEYEWNGSAWVNKGEVTGSTATLPNVPFTVNYNARDYDSTTHTITKASGQLNNMDAVITGQTSNIVDHHEDGYIQITGDVRANISDSSVNQYFNRDNNNPNMTIIEKSYVPGSSKEGNIIVNRDGNYNWMYRHMSFYTRLHGSSIQGSINVSNSEPNICSIRVDSNRLLTYRNHTQSTTSTTSSFNYGNTTSNGAALFCGYSTTSSEYWKGYFYWVYMTQNTLTDEQVQQVIDHNEALSIGVYPVYYDEVQDPPQNITFSTMQEALAYQCPYVGLYATIDGDLYVFNSNYEWESLSFTLTGVTTSNASFNLKINGTDNRVTIFRDNGDNTYNWGLVYTSPITNVSAMCSGNTSIKTFDWYDADVSSLTSIGSNAFRNCSSLSSITIPNSVTSIGGLSFSGCSSLSSITIPSGVTSISQGAFGGCSSLTSIDIPSGVTSIGAQAFSGCRGLSSITIPSGVTSINNYTFQACSGLTSITIPSGVTSIGVAAFENCKGLTSINIQSGVTSIGNYAFQGCNGLTSITIPNSVTGVGKYAFQNCYSITSLTIPDSVKTIGDWGFAYLESVTSLTIGSGVTSIGRQALCGYKQNESITVSPNNTKFNSNNNCNAVIETATNKLVVACKNTVIPNTITIIGEAAYQGCTGLTSIELSENITALDFAAFYECINLTSLTIHATTPPKLGSSALQKTNNCPIYVPSGSVEAYKTASGWSSFASRIQAIPTPPAPTLGWVTFNAGDDITGLQIYGIRGTADDLSYTNFNSSIQILQDRRTVEVNIYFSGGTQCYSNVYSNSDTVELIFDNVSCNEYYIGNSTTVGGSNPIELYIPIT